MNIKIMDDDEVCKIFNNFTIEVKVHNERIHSYTCQTIVLGERRSPYLRPSLVQRHQPLQ